MNVDTLQFTPMSAAAGGLMIGTAVALYLLLNGRVAGISGMLGRLIDMSSTDRAAPLAFLVGLIAAPWLWRLFAPLPPVTVSSSNATLIVAGLLVGFGTRYGSGCTSGHGVCGLSRGSARSLVATVTFMAFGILTVFLHRYI